MFLVTNDLGWAEWLAHPLRLSHSGDHGVGLGGALAPGVLAAGRLVHDGGDDPALAVGDRKRAFELREVGERGVGEREHLFESPRVVATSTGNYVPPVPPPSEQKR